VLVADANQICRVRDITGAAEKDILLQPDAAACGAILPFPRMATAVTLLTPGPDQSRL